MQNDQQKKYHTKSRDAIMTYLDMHREHSFSAYDVNAYMRENGIQVNLTTIYRNLDKLTESGVIMKYKTAGDECCRYQCARPHAQCHEHIHMQCRACGKILHLECGFMEEIVRHLYEHHRFALECAGSVLMGVCAECRTKMNDSEGAGDDGNVGYL
ncbi:MAG: transcriptional repressor [Lachnospiraceae bacterium]|nr:transcriptional repressor [Lachnospiraceae bacterium]MDE6940234.1 transcriptional repressor [Lachnospiraceae bacterium]